MEGQMTLVDNDVIVLEDAKDAAFAMEKEYRKALLKGELATATEIKQRLEEVFDNYSLARLNLLKEGMLATEADVAEMRRIKAEIDLAADKQQLIEGAVRFVGFLAKFIV